MSYHFSLKLNFTKMFVLLALFLCSAYAGQNESDLSPDILGGSSADIQQFPFQVSLQEKKHFCGGSIISDQWVLTSAVCLLGKKPANVKVIAGTATHKSGGKSYKTTKFIIHEAFQPVTLIHDIGLVLTKERIKYSNKILLVALSSYGTPTPPWVTLSGWGYTKSSSNKLSDTLQQVNLLSLDNYQCSSYLPGSSPAGSNLCTSSQVGQGGCTGDIGGPLTDVNRQQFGIYSYGRGSCGQGLPDVYTSVAYYREWIRFSSGV